MQGVYHDLLQQLGPELDILRHVEAERIAQCGYPLVAEGVAESVRVGSQSRLATMVNTASSRYLRLRNGVTWKRSRGKHLRSVPWVQRMLPLQVCWRDLRLRAGGRAASGVF